MALNEYGFIASFKKKSIIVNKITQPNKINCSI